MPWSDITPMSQRLEFVHLVQRGRHTMVEACCIFAISEKTGYKWIARFAAGGVAALADRSHAPLAPAHQLAPALAAKIIALRARHPTWGPRKLRQRLRTLAPTLPWPAMSTIGALLTRHGLVRARPRRARDRIVSLESTLTAAAAPNDVWTADFKGEFLLRGGRQDCYPLTIADLCSRALLGCRALAGTASAPAQGAFRRVFQRYGLPRVMRTDNGVPFAHAHALGGLSTLAVWWLHLGIRPERIAPGRPQQNGVHERMHRTLKAEATRPPAPTLDTQQRRFDRFRHEFNQERPHEGLGGATPASQYTASGRPYPSRLPGFEYAAELVVRRVRTAGSIKWLGHSLFLSTILAGEDVALEEREADRWTITLGPLVLGVFEPACFRFTPGVYWQTDNDG
jgi:putative transposase